MKTITIKVPEDVKNKVQRADIECSSRRSIITTILGDNSKRAHGSISKRL
jgi:predicted transcriptional regulator